MSPDPPGPAALIAGEALVDVVRAEGQAQREHPGGSPANVAFGLARLGRPVHLSTWFGDDDRGALLRAHLTSAGVHLIEGSDRARRTSTALAELDARGVAEYTFDLDWQLPPTVVADHVQVLHTGSIAATLPPGADDVAQLLHTGATRATISYDPNLRPAIMGEPSAVRGRVQSLVAAADVVKVSDEDLGWLHPEKDPIAVARSWVASGAGIVVVTCGGKPAVGVTANEMVIVPSTPAQVVDTVGAGDSYMAALLDALWQADLLGAHRRGALHQIGTTHLRAAMQQAGAAAAITVSRAGADPPTRADLDRALSHPPGTDTASAPTEER